MPEDKRKELEQRLDLWTELPDKDKKDIEYQIKRKEDIKSAMSENTMRQFLKNNLGRQIIK